MSLSRKFAGRLFQTRGPATAKLLSPNVLCVRGTAHDLSVDERSRRRGPSETKCMYHHQNDEISVVQVRMHFMNTLQILLVQSYY